MYNLWHNLQLVEGGQYLREEEVEKIRICVYNILTFPCHAY
jgi:hypothetical protein